MHVQNLTRRRPLALRGHIFVDLIWLGHRIYNGPICKQLEYIIMQNVSDSIYQSKTLSQAPCHLVKLRCLIVWASSSGLFLDSLLELQSPGVHKHACTSRFSSLRNSALNSIIIFLALGLLNENNTSVTYFTLHS